MYQFSGPYRLESPLVRSPALPLSAASSAVAVVSGAVLSSLYVPHVSSPYFRPSFMGCRHVSAHRTIAHGLSLLCCCRRSLAQMCGHPRPRSRRTTSPVASPQRRLRPSRSPRRGWAGASLGVDFTLAGNLSLVCVGRSGGRVPGPICGAASSGLLLGGLLQHLHVAAVGLRYSSGAREAAALRSALQCHR
ncbi:hypothetical protein NDU88_010228 [Pleurodeles waltl]|uniref:Uncharacterized protein n=1 Tax=Pleurodeles waltl TaxID=8319 RepID=A0AAV7QTW1_PLEWA|nr:hypothetical protein NDU88_010228 [Pleurodeles waltl]